MQPKAATACVYKNQTHRESCAAGLVDPMPTLTMSWLRLLPCTCTLAACLRGRSSSVSSRRGACRLQAHALVRPTGEAVFSSRRGQTGDVLSSFVAALIRAAPTFSSHWCRRSKDFVFSPGNAERGQCQPYQRSSLGPSTAPATVHKTIVPPYQSAMKGSRSSMQCKA